VNALRLKHLAGAADYSRFSAWAISVSIAIENPHYNVISPVVINIIAALVGLTITDLQRRPNVGVVQKTDITRVDTRRRDRNRRGITVRTLTRPDQATLDDPRRGVD
jgi:hypothetical protein